MELRTFVEYRDKVGGGMGSKWSDDDDEDDMDEGEAGSTLDTLKSGDDAEEVHGLEDILDGLPDSAQDSLPSTPQKGINYLFRSLRIKKPQSPPIPSLIKFGTKRAIQSDHIPSVNSSTPEKGRTHGTARKFLRFFWRTALCVARSTTQGNLEVIQAAIGGRFGINSCINYIPLQFQQRSDLDHLDRVLIYLTQNHVLDAIEVYLSRLDAEDTGEPTKQKQLVDHFLLLRSGHPVMGDGHRFAFRFVETTPATEPPLRPVPFFSEPSGIPYTTPYIDLPHFDTAFATSWRCWLEFDQARWIQWSVKQPGLVHLQNIRTVDGTAVPELARFLVVAGHLRRRIGADFSWKPVRGPQISPPAPFCCTFVLAFQAKDKGLDGEKRCGNEHYLMQLALRMVNLLEVLAQLYAKSSNTTSKMYKDLSRPQCHSYGFAFTSHGPPTPICTTSISPLPRFAITAASPPNPLPPSTASALPPASVHPASPSAASCLKP
ncbi:hypothetical protein C8R44DRAFT_891166 [Mycena epipterygia]|nr:hypothetical protein C8R44DRAFT_891166 [Mycena epipterygia]